MQLFSSPQHKQAARTRSEPTEKEKLEVSSTDNTRQASVTSTARQRRTLPLGLSTLIFALAAAHQKRLHATADRLAAETEQRNSSELSNRISRIFQKCGIKTQAEKQSGQHHARVDVGFHSLRHTYVSLCANAGVPLALVQSIIGHSNPMMTLHYHHASEDALKTAVAALPDVTGKHPAG